MKNTSWLNPPTRIEQETPLRFMTDPDTDFWRNTHYQFNRQTGHALLQDAPNGEFKCRIEVKLKPNATYDQAGILLYVNDDHWVKVSAEFIPDGPSHLGAVVTSFGYSDWSCRDVDNTLFDAPLFFELHYLNQDVTLYHVTGEHKEQLRIAHLHDVTDLKIGPYACSPDVEAAGCEVEVLDFSLETIVK